MNKIPGFASLAILLVFGVTELSFTTKSGMAFNNVEQLASKLNSTIQQLGAHVVMYSVYRKSGEGSTQIPGSHGYTRLVVDGESGGLGNPRYREEIFEIDDQKGVIGHQMSAFDGNVTRQFTPTLNSGSIKRGELFLSGDTIRQVYRELWGQYLPALLLGEFDFANVQNFIPLGDGIYRVVLEATTRSGGARYTIDFDARYGALPVTILRQNGRPSGTGTEMVWMDFTETEVVDWIEVDTNLYFPNKTILRYSGRLSLSPIEMSILAFDQKSENEITAIASEFAFPEGCIYENLDNGTLHRFGMDLAIEEGLIPIDPDEVKSFFEHSFSGMTKDNAMELFQSIESLSEEQ